MKLKRNKPVEHTGCGSPGRLRRIVSTALVPVRLGRPSIHPQFSKLGQIQRVAEVLRLSILRAEYWLSPSGALREWLRLNIKLGLVLGIPTFLLTPVITMLFASAETWSALMARIFVNLAYMPAWLSTGILGITTILFLLRLLFGR